MQRQNSIDLIRPIIQGQAVQMDIEPNPVMIRAGQGMTGTQAPQRLIDLAIDSVGNDEPIGMPNMETDDED